jgi:hypothetical protein
MNCKDCGCFMRKDDLREDPFDPEEAIVWFCENCGESEYIKEVKE